MPGSLVQQLPELAIEITNVPQHPPFPIGAVPLKGVLVTDLAKLVGPTDPILRCPPTRENPS